MIHQVMLSGNMKTDVFTSLGQDDVQRIYDHVIGQGFTGMVIYTDGSFLTLYEGDKDAIERSRATYANTERYSNIITMLSRPIEKREFTDYKIGVGRQDFSEELRRLPYCFCLGHGALNNVFPASFPNEFQILIRTFARVNNLMAV